MKYGKECICGRGGECQGVSAAFALLKDPRRGYVQLPQHHGNPRTHAESDANAMRAAYLRHLRRTEESLLQQQAGGSDRWFVALHHFHPTVVQKHSEMPGALSPIPKTLKKVDLKFLSISLGDEDRVRDENGRKRKVYYFCPSWPMESAKEDLKRIIRISRLVSEATAPATATAADATNAPRSAPPKVGAPHSPQTPSSSAASDAVNRSAPPRSAPPTVPLLPPTSLASRMEDVADDAGAEDVKKPAAVAAAVSTTTTTTTATAAAVTATTEAVATEEVAAATSETATEEKSAATPQAAEPKSSSPNATAIAAVATIATAAAAAQLAAAAIASKKSEEEENATEAAPPQDKTKPTTGEISQKEEGEGTIEAAAPKAEQLLASGNESSPAVAIAAAVTAATAAGIGGAAVAIASKSDGDDDENAIETPSEEKMEQISEEMAQQEEATATVEETTTSATEAAEPKASLASGNESSSSPAVAIAAAATAAIAAGVGAMAVASKGDDDEDENAIETPSEEKMEQTPEEISANTAPEEKKEATLEEISAEEDTTPAWLAAGETRGAATTATAVAGELTVITTFANDNEETKEKQDDSPSAPQQSQEEAIKEQNVTGQSTEIDIVKAEAPLTSKIFEQEYSEEKLPSNMTMESEEGRIFLFRRMCNFESTRQATSAALVKEFSARWRASLEIMQAGIFEMARAERVIRGAALANKEYADAMQAMYDDVYLDSEGNTVLDPRTQNRIAKEREGLEYTVEEAGASPEFLRGKAHTRSAMLGSMVESQAVIAKKFSDNSENILEQIITDLYNLRAYLKKQMIDFKRRGDPFIRDIQDSEREIRTAFAVFELIGASPGNFAGQSSSFHSKRGFFRSGAATPMQAIGSFHGTPLSPTSLHGTPGSPTSSPRLQKGGLFRRSRHGTTRNARAGSVQNLFTNEHGSSHGRSKHGSNHGGISPQHDEQLLALDPKLLANLNSPMANALRSNTIVRDGWLVEMIYRQAVNSQVQILQKCGGPLENIWQSMQNIEVNRQVRLHEVLLEFMPRQRRLFLGLSPIAAPILEDLVETRLDPKELEEQVEETVQKHSEVLLKNTNAQRSSIMNRSRATAPNLEELHGMLTGEFFDNGLLKAAKIVERRTGVRGHWKIALVVVTSDKYLHMFDLSNFPQVFLGGAPEPVFELLLPDYDLPSLESDYIQRREDDLLKNLTPVASVHLSKCSSTVPDEDPRAMDIVESGLSGLIRSTRKFTLRTTGREETKQWVELMQSCQGDPTPPEPEPETIQEEGSSPKAQNKAAPETLLARV